MYFQCVPDKQTRPRHNSGPCKRLAFGGRFCHHRHYSQLLECPSSTSRRHPTDYCIVMHVDQCMLGPLCCAATAPSESRSNLAHKPRPVSTASVHHSSLIASIRQCPSPPSVWRRHRIMLNVNAETCSSIVDHVFSIRDIRFY